MSQYIKIKYYQLFHDINGKETVYEFSCGVGWHSIIEHLCQNIIMVVNKHSELTAEERQVSVVQIKEKFGSLRLYVGPVHQNLFNEVNALIYKAEEESAKTCEYCGLIGKMRNTRWVKTLCDNCHEIRQRKIESM